MSSRPPRSSRPNSKSSKLLKNNNIQMFKLIDPIGQSLLFILFVYCLDRDAIFPYRGVLYTIVAWQMTSALINLFFNDPKMLRIQRLAYFFFMIGYTAFFFFYEKNVKETFVALDRGEKPTIPVHQLVLMSIAILVAFWYTVICYREIRSVLGAINRGK